MSRPKRAFTIIELLVVVAIISLLIGILLPAISKARDQAKLSASQANLRNLAAAHTTYAAAWNDRQLTLIDDNFASWGENVSAAKAAYEESWGSYHPPILLGWAPGEGGNNPSGGNRLWGYWSDPPNGGNIYRCLPISFYGTLEYFGSFRLMNCKQFHQYVGGRFYDAVFYAPKDISVLETIRPCEGAPGEFCIDVETPNGGIGWCSYVMSPAAMYNPEVFRDPDRGGFQDPFSMPAGVRSPSFSQAKFPSLKTHVLEHHWLQSARATCNPNFQPGTYDGCEPYYFNHGWESSPMTLFYDGHIEGIGCRKAERADLRQQSLVGWGLWSKDTHFGENGYFIDRGYDQATTSFHILTTDGIKGRDIIAD